MSLFPIRRLIRFLFPPPPFAKPINQTISPEPPSEILMRDEATFAVRLGLVRSRQQAMLLFKRYGVKSVDELLPLLPKRRKRNRLHDLILRIDGHDRRDMYKQKARDTLPTRYRMRD